MVGSLLVVCVGNICRSPMGERLLQKLVPQVKIASAGLSAVLGSGADQTALGVAAEHGISLEGHVARQLTAEIGVEHELILTMEPGHRSEIMRRYPHLSGRTMLFDQWSGARGIADPYRKSIDFHRQTWNLIEIAARTWVTRLT